MVRASRPPQTPGPHARICYQIFTVFLNTVKMWLTEFWFVLGAIDFSSIKFSNGIVKASHQGIVFNRADKQAHEEVHLHLSSRSGAPLQPLQILHPWEFFLREVKKGAERFGDRVSSILHIVTTWQRCPWLSHLNSAYRTSSRY